MTTKCLIFFRTRFLVFCCCCCFFFFKKRTEAFVQRIGRQALHNSPQDQNYTRTLAKFHGYNGRSLTNFFFFELLYITENNAFNQYIGKKLTSSYL